MDFILSPECQHARNGRCSKCVLNQSFSISPAEDNIRRNFSGTGLSDKFQHSGSKGEKSLEQLESFPSLPVKTVQPQSEDAELADSYTSFADLDSFSNVQIQDENNRDHEYLTCPLVEPCSLLMRLFKSDLFSPFIAIRYLFSSTEKDVRVYLGSKLFGFDSEEVDFYLPQLINMYIMDGEIAAALHPFFVTRCHESVHFSLTCVWLLESFGVDRIRISNKNLAQGEFLRQLIVNNFQAPKPLHSLQRMSILGDRPRIATGSVLSAESLSNGLHLTRSESASASLRCMATSSPGGCLDNGCRCFENPRTEKCSCGADPLSAEHEFITWLTTIGTRLTDEPSKGEKTRRLVTELIRLNMSLPARVWVPFSFDHIVLRIPPTNSCVLNSKDKAPYCIYVEVLRCDDVTRVSIPRNLTDAESELHLRLRSASIASLNDASIHSAPDPSTGGQLDCGDEIEVVECQDNTDVVTVFPEASPVPDPAWDSMSLQSSASEPVMRNGRLQPAELSRRLKHWVNNKRPGKRRQMRPHPDDPSASTMSEPWEEKRDRIRQGSPYGRLPGWDLLPVIVKSGDDLAQELLVYQLLSTLKAIWEEEHVSLYLRPYKILVTSPTSGMIEPIVDACSLHQIKRNQAALFLEEGRTGVPSLESHFVEAYGPKGTGTYLRAQQNFVQSCAAYSLVCYFLQVKDRHNGNILIDADGNLIHIDFGFILSVTPKNLGFEMSPFKLTTEMINVMGGIDSDLFLYFKTLLLKGLIAARKHHERIMTVVEIMYKGSSLPCFRGGSTTLKSMQDRFHVTFTDTQLENLVNSMISQSHDSLTTRLYDNFQYYTNGIL